MSVQSKKNKRFWIAAVMIFMFLAACFPVYTDLDQIDEIFGTHFSDHVIHPDSLPAWLLLGSSMYQLHGKFMNTNYAGAMELSTTKEPDMLDNGDQIMLTKTFPSDEGVVIVQLVSNEKLVSTLADGLQSPPPGFYEPYIVLKRHNDLGYVCMRISFISRNFYPLSAEDLNEKNTEMVEWLIENVL